MTEAEKITRTWWENMNLDAVDLIHQVAERTREECERASTFELAPHPRWSMKIGDAIRAAKWEDKEVI